MTKQSEILVNHEQRLKQLESDGMDTVKRVQIIYEEKIPSMERKLEALSVKITNMTAINFVSIVIGVILTKVLK